MNEKNEQIFFILLRIFIGFAIFGILVLMITNFGKNPSNIAFSLIFFIISTAALVMTTLQSVSISRQIQTTNHAARLVKETADEIQKLITEERLLERDIRKDLAADEGIVAILEEYGIGANKQERRKVAAKIAEKVGKKQ